MKCPTCDTDENVIKNGLRETKKGTIQRYYCKSCGNSFSDSKSPRTEYPENVILYTLEQYNRGYPAKVAKKRTGKNTSTRLHKAQYTHG
ncbi:MAG: IS1 family transposase [Candidatus Thermoplasmatota archaeon]|nr:IS1 family transposase [Candidatus Thermoplasmatota archaeon]MBS3790098.1 IS1 family transposase [Candidatus Thermoplasmatota archaeon]